MLTGSTVVFLLCLPSWGPCNLKFKSLAHQVWSFVWEYLTDPMWLLATLQMVWERINPREIHFGRSQLASRNPSGHCMGCGIGSIANLVDFSYSWDLTVGMSRIFWTLQASLETVLSSWTTEIQKCASFNLCGSFILWVQKWFRIILNTSDSKR
jgi:hypothetical protein